MALVSQGIVRTFDRPVTVHLLDPMNDSVTTQTIPLGPAASQIAIEQLGTNGGGLYNVNSAHPFENSTPLSNLLEMVALILITAALCCTFGVMVKDTRQGWAVLAALAIILVPLGVGTLMAEQAGTPALAAAGASLAAGELQAGGNMEGKELRFGIVNNALWSTATTAASNGAVNAMHQSFSPIWGIGSHLADAAWRNRARWRRKRIW